MQITQGVPWLTEIMNGIKDIKTPIIKTLLLNEKFEASARIVKARIEITWLGEISKYIKEVYTP